VLRLGASRRGKVSRFRSGIPSQMTPEVSAVVLLDGEQLPLARVGPTATYDVDVVLSELLDDQHLGRHLAAVRGRHVRIECTAVFADTTPSIVLSRLLLGQLVTVNASLALHLQVLPIPSLEPGGPPTRDESRVSFTLETGEDRDPNEVTERLSLRPTEVIYVGDRRGTLKRPSSRAAWQLETTLGSPDLNGQFAQMLSVLVPRAEVIALLTTHQYDGILSLIGSFGGQVPDINLAQEQLAVVRRLGAELDIDLGAG
jgi:hypothetical protein